jgi:hypothetical protein
MFIYQDGLYHGTEKIDWRGKIIYPAVCGKFSLKEYQHKDS